MPEDLYQAILDTSVPNHYQLLGLKYFENDQNVIHRAGLEKMKKLKAWDLHEDEKTASQIKEIHIQLSRAIADLEDKDRKKKYDSGLAKSLGIPIPYAIQTEQAEKAKLKSVDNRQKPKQYVMCPNCSKRNILDEDIVCKQCGYDLQTPVEPDVPSLGNLHHRQSAESKSSAVNLAGLSQFLFSFIKLALLIGFVALFCFGFWASLKPGENQYTLTMDGDHQYEEYWRSYIENSSSWQEYFDKKAKDSSKPYVTIKIFEQYEAGGMKRRVYKPDLQVIDPETGDILCTGKIRYYNFDDFKTKAEEEINDLGDKLLRDLQE